MEKEKIIAWIGGYAAGTLTPGDEAPFLEWYRQAGLEEFHQLLAACKDLPESFSRFPEMPEDFKARLERDIRNFEPAEKQKTFGIIYSFQKSRWWWAAASAVIISAAGYFYSAQKNNKKQTDTAHVSRFKNDVAPGGNKAILTLSNGSMVVLDSVHVGTLAIQGKAKVLKLDSGRLSYSPTGGGQVGAVYNTLTTPRGGQYQLDLPDGSRAWLDAASSITYPTAFTGAERKVDITGQVYFEVAKNKDWPFIVETKDVHVQVLGTHFNVNSYDDEIAVRTTLLEGSIRISSGNNSALLAPGQQAAVNKNREIELLKEVDTEPVMAWKNGLFNFKSQDIEAVMRQVSRWYDVEIVYDGEKPAGHFSGMVNRNTNVSTVLKMLELSNVQFTIEGKKITIMNK